ncbi:MAG TPA: LapA family protein [Deltaproteobacteria bacterium]|nr:LapA family protein [Deltaproteobacteria bacterium]
MRIIYLILLIIFAFIVVTFSQFNSDPVNLKYYNLFDVVVPTYILIFAALLAGVIFTGFYGVVERFRLNRTISKLNRTIRELRKEIRAHEPPPLVEEPTTQQQDLP